MHSRYTEIAVAYASHYADDESVEGTPAGARASRAEMARRLIAEIESITRLASELDSDKSSAGAHIGSITSSGDGKTKLFSTESLDRTLTPLADRLRATVRAAWAPPGSIAGGGFRTRGMAGAASAVGADTGIGIGFVGGGGKGVSLAKEMSQVVNMSAFKNAFKRKG